MKTIKASKLNPVAMACDIGKGKLPYKVIKDGCVMQYVGIGWVHEKKANKSDYDKLPVVVK